MSREPGRPVNDGARAPQLRSASKPLRIFLGWLIAAAGALAIFMSWGALHDLALHVGGMPVDRAIVFPIVVDLPALAAMLIALLVPAPSRFLRTLPWFTFGLFSALTVAGNAAAVAIADPGTMILGQTPAVIVNAVPAIALLLTTHLAAATVYRRDDRRARATQPATPVRSVLAARSSEVPPHTPAPATSSRPHRASSQGLQSAREIEDRTAKRVRVLELVGTGATVRSAARTAGVASTTAQRWVERARTDGTLVESATVDA